MRMYKASNNNCLQCCLAALLDTPLERMPNYDTLESKGADWFDFLYWFILPEYDLVTVVVKDDQLLPLIHIEVFELKGSTKPHAVVVGQDGEIVLDPDSLNTDELREGRSINYRLYFIHQRTWPQRRLS